MTTFMPSSPSSHFKALSPAHNIRQSPWYYNLPSYTLLATELGAIDETSLTTGGMTEHLIAGGTGDYGLGMTEDSGDVKATLAFNVHEVGVRALYEALLLVEQLLRSGQRVEQVHNQLIWLVSIIKWS